MTAARTAPSVDLSMLLNQAGYALTSRLSAALAEVAISVRVYCVLAKAAEGDFTQSQLAELAWMDKTTMVVTLDEMEARGLAERRLSPGDRRVRVIAITAKGRRLLDSADRIVQDLYDDLLAKVAPRQREAFLAVLEQLVAGPLAAPFHLEKPTRRRRQGRSAA
jgi:MarR family transcriptional regulator, transcriptional regulator for hemolysin